MGYIVGLKWYITKSQV